MILIAIFVMLSATTAQHLGLTDAIIKIISRIAHCSKCLSFWSVVGVLVWLRYDLVLSVFVALLMSYLSNWFSLVLFFLNELYSGLWERLNKHR